MASRDVLALVHDGGVRLDDGRLPEWTEDDVSAPALLTSARADFYLSPTVRLAPDLFVHVVGAWDPPPGHWVQPGEVPGEPAVTAAVARAVRQWAGDEPVHAARADWFRPGWLEDVEAWVDDALARVGRVRTGRLVVVRQWSLSAVLRVPTELDGQAGTVIFKATAAHFHAEPALARVLSGIAPDRLPLLVAEDDERVWMLMEPLRGLDGRRDAEPGAGLAPLFTDLQVRSLTRLEELRQVGCRDRGLEATLSAFDDLLHHSVMFGDLTDEELTAARGAAPRAYAVVREFWACGLPDTLSHGDLHPGNVAYDGEELRIFDWTDAAVSHPFLDVAHYARSCLGREETAATPRLEMAADVVDAFAEGWRQSRPDADVDTAVRLAPFVDQLYQAVSYEGIYRAVEPESRWELAGVVEQMLRELPGLLDAVDGS